MPSWLPDLAAADGEGGDSSQESPGSLHHERSVPKQRRLARHDTVQAAAFLGGGLFASETDDGTDGLQIVTAEASAASVASEAASKASVASVSAKRKCESQESVAESGIQATPTPQKR